MPVQRQQVQERHLHKPGPVRNETIPSLRTQVLLGELEVSRSASLLIQYLCEQKVTRNMEPSTWRVTKLLGRSLQPCLIERFVSLQRSTVWKMNFNQCPLQRGHLHGSKVGRSANLSWGRFTIYMHMQLCGGGDKRNTHFKCTRVLQCHC